MDKTADMSEWADWTDTSDASRAGDVEALAQRRRYERNVSALWQDVKGSINETIRGVNNQIPAGQRVECGESMANGLALTRWNEYPVAFLDVSVDVDSGMIGCLYTFAAKPGDPYTEQHKVWLMRDVEAGIVVTDERGNAVSSCEELARQVVEAYLANL